MLVYWSWKTSHGTIYGSCKAKKGGGSLRKNEKPSLFLTGKYLGWYIVRRYKYWPQAIQHGLRFTGETEKPVVQCPRTWSMMLKCVFVCKNSCYFLVVNRLRSAWKSRFIHPFGGATKPLHQKWLFHHFQPLKLGCLEFQAVAGYSVAFEVDREGRYSWGYRRPELLLLLILLSMDLTFVAWLGRELDRPGVSWGKRWTQWRF